MAADLNQTVLWVDDDRLRTDRFAEELRTHGIEVFQADTAGGAIRLLEERGTSIGVAVVDIVVPAGDTTAVRSLGDLRTGLMLANWIRRNYPNVRLIGFSLEDVPDVRAWFEQYHLDFFSKRITRYGIVDKVRAALDGAKGRRSPRTFIVHGHDEASTYQLKSYLQNTLGFDEPLILKERRSSGRTVVEKLEDEAEGIDVVFVLFTPDETSTVTATGKDYARSRPNVLFEAGYFYGKLERTNGKVIFLVKGNVDLPSDIAGVVCIDISAGIVAAGEQIRRELQRWL